MASVFMTAFGPKTIEDLIKIVQEEFGDVFKIYCEWSDPKTAANRTWLVSAIGSKKVEIFQRFSTTGQVNKRTFPLHSPHLKKMIRVNDNKDILPFVRDLFPVKDRNPQQVIWKFTEENNDI